MLLLHHVGAKSGKARVTPLLYLPDGGDAVIVASKGGTDKHPAWFHNLIANPETVAQLGGERRPVTAEVADPADRQALWPRLVEIYGPYEDYQRQTDRTIPLVRLKPRA